jgi:4a-hydroxytetrahydrobiopterin dehydratase
MGTHFPRIGAVAALENLVGWQVVEGRDAIQKRYIFTSFNTAFGFMTRVAMVAEKWDHHPAWSNVYNEVEILLATHDVGGVTELDVRMAQFMDEAATALGATPR